MTTRAPRRDRSRRRDVASRAPSTQRTLCATSARRAFGSVGSTFSLLDASASTSMFDAGIAIGTTTGGVCGARDARGRRVRAMIEGERR
jgi:hypothetical protein